VTTLRAGDYFGELAALDINPINLTTVTATQSCELYSLSNERLKTAFFSMPEVLNHMKDIVLEKAIVMYKLDADVHQDNEMLNKFFEEQTKKAMEYKDKIYGAVSNANNDTGSTEKNEKEKEEKKGKVSQRTSCSKLRAQRAPLTG